MESRGGGKYDQMVAMADKGAQNLSPKAKYPKQEPSSIIPSNNNIETQLYEISIKWYTLFTVVDFIKSKNISGLYTYIVYIKYFVGIIECFVRFSFDFATYRY